MSLKHNPFDNSYKGTFVRRKKVFENPIPKLEVEINAVPSPNKLETKWRQTEDKVETISEINLGQTRDKVETSRKDLSPLLIETRDKVETQPETQLETKRRQTEDKVETKTSLSALVGLQRKLVVFLYHSCKAARDSSTEALAIEHIAKSCETSSSSAKKTLQRLEQKAFLKRVAYRDGRGGWTKYELGKDIFQDLLRAETEDKLETKWRHTEDKVGTQPETQPRTAPLCSSSDLNITNNTTTTEPEFWLIVPKNLDGMVPVKQLREFVRQDLISADEIQTSLDGFAYDLEKGAVRAKNGNPIAVLIGAIKSGGYISQQYLSELKASLAEVERAREELRTLQSENVAEQLKAEFESFREKFPEQAEKIKPTGKFINSFQPGGIGYRMWLEEYKLGREKEQLSELGDATP